MAKYLPKFCGYDADRGILILELVRGARNFRAHHLRTGRYSTTLARGLGDALGILHDHAVAEVQLINPGTTPWILSIHRPGPSVFREASAANLEIIKIVQSTPDFGQHFDQLRSTWQPSCLIHQDLKWENFLAYRRPGARITSVKVIDWEALCPGDPSWDIGSIFSHYLSFWLESVPVKGRYPSHFSPELAHRPLHRMQPALRAFWRAYATRRGLKDTSAASLLVRAVSFAGAGLVANAYGAARALGSLDSNLISHLQLAMNMMSRPHDAAVYLLGIAAEVE
jgi:Phosphotransferase enzyme family